MRRHLLVALGVSVLSVCLSVAPASAAPNSIETVMPDDLAVNTTDWYFYDDTNDVPSTAEVPGKYQFVPGPGTPPAGKGSVRFDNTGSERWNVATSQFKDTKIADLRKINFSTYQPSTNPGNPQYSVYLNFDVDFDGPGGNSAYQGRLVYVPRTNGTVLQNTWQKWVSLADGAQWTWSRLASNGNQWPDGNANANRTWQDIVAAFPNATISGQLLFRSGEPYPDGFTGYLDRLVFKMKGERKVGFDLEPSLKPSAESDCKNGGWKTFNDPSFNSQRQCEKFVQYGDVHHRPWWARWLHDGDFDEWDSWFGDHRHFRGWSHDWDD